MSLFHDELQHPSRVLEKSTLFTQCRLFYFMLESRHNMSKEKLALLEESGEHVFHGSADGTIEELEPRQGRHIPNLEKPEQFMLDGRPAVSATPHAKLATFRALINSTNIPIDHNSGFGIEGEKETYRVSSEEVLEHTKGKSGYVYVFNKNSFKPYTRGRSEENARPDSMEWRSYTPVKPLEVIEVTDKDLPNRDEIEVGDRRE